MKLTIDDSELTVLEYHISKIEDNFYEMAEAAALMVGGLGGGTSQLDVYLGALGSYQE
jgi:hypothetical protein